MEDVRSFGNDLVEATERSQSRLAEKSVEKFEEAGNRVVEQLVKQFKSTGKEVIDHFIKETERVTKEERATSRIGLIEKALETKSAVDDTRKLETRLGNRIDRLDLIQSGEEGREKQTALIIKWLFAFIGLAVGVIGTFMFRKKP